MLLLCQLKLPLLPLRCTGELGLLQPGSPGDRGAGHSKQVDLRRAVLDRDFFHLPPLPPHQTSASPAPRC
ncbi:unnamed protein product [Pleuronectes platessa]|uniref:Secreted protein n=1 Tax=Pleuronectes platessa TaxID=8262 RepID=A0A9N7Z7J2_PLEPL|nr:unnamed protein product [Pleuronectes platessa]